MQIITAKIHFKYTGLVQYLSWLRGLAQRADKGPVVEPTELDEKAPPAVAYVNHGRWVADCPSGCGGAMLLDVDMPFMCGECFNAELGGQWRRVEWPNDRLKIEFYLERRVLAHTANWRPQETIEMLKAENEQRGLG